MKTTQKQRDDLRQHVEPRLKWLDADTCPNPDFLLNLVDDIDTLKAALEQVEWVDSGSEYYYDICPWCDNYKEHKHRPDCPRKLALREE